MVEGMNGYQHPLLTAYFAPEELAALRQLWADRQHYLGKLAQLPQTLCHLDAHRGNLSWQGDDLAMFDWAFVGAGALGEELAAFVGRRCCWIMCLWHMQIGWSGWLLLAIWLACKPLVGRMIKT